MDIAVIEGFSQREMEQFKTVCNHLLSHTFVVRTIVKHDTGRIHNPDYSFLTRYFLTIKDYLALLDWELRHDDYHGYFYLLHKDEVNRLNLNKTATALLLAIRLIYEENQERVGLERDVICTVRDVLEKVVTDYAILSTRPNMDEVRQGLTLLENHSVLQRLEGRFHQPGCKFAILPTILTAVSGERLEAIVAAIRKEESIEEIDEDPVD